MNTDSFSDASWVAGLLAMDDLRFGGAVVDEDAVEAFTTVFLQAGGTFRTIPSSMAVDALTGAIDLASTLAMGKPVMTPGLLSKLVCQ
jgi:hypothetical protein